MKIHSFRAEGVHGYLRFNIRFRSDLTFLTGINGSGKTTVLNCIVALIAPSLDVLANIQYDFIKISFIENGEEGFIKSQRSDNGIEITSSSSNDPLVYQPFVADSTISAIREEESEREYYKILATTTANHPVLKQISSLPTPMFLGLDRRARFGEEMSRARVWQMRQPRPSRNVFSSSLARSLAEAAILAEDRHRDNLIAAGRLGEEVRRDLTLELLTVKAVPSLDDVSFPSRADRRKLADMRRSVQNLHQVLGLKEDEVRQRIIPFLDILDEYAKKIPNIIEQKNKQPQFKPTEAVAQALFGWHFNRSQLQRIEAMSKIVARYTDSMNELEAPSKKYLEALNSYLKDSAKKLAFDPRGYIHYQTNSSEEMRPMSTLSSGEAQIFMILTHLSFNPQVQGDNVFIIDEPELSLHVQWQELFVDSVLGANNSIQYIMATHSPSIILEKLSNCVDISPNGREE